MGSHVAKYLTANVTDTIVCLDQFGGIHGPNGPVKCIDLANIHDLNELFKLEKFEAVIHLAAMTNPGEALNNPTLCYLSNVSNTISLVQLCVRYGVNKFIYASTAAVYGVQACRLIHEDVIPSPTNPYSRSKVMCEGILKDTAIAHPEFNYVTVRIFFSAGTDGTLELAGQVNSNLIGNVIKVAAQAASGKRDGMVIYGDSFDTPDGSCVRDYVHINDISKIFDASLKYLASGNGSTEVNCGTSKGHSVKEIVSTMKRISGVDFNVDVVLPRDNEAPALIADITRARRLLKWEPDIHTLDSLCSSAFELEKMLP